MATRASRSLRIESVRVESSFDDEDDGKGDTFSWSMVAHGSVGLSFGCRALLPVRSWWRDMEAKARSRESSFRPAAAQNCI